ncbi:LacI family transcriptional regulator [Gammaproteobacteria bacterium]|nr:LacI family transcriptional regulator [Gammaproteobacteria bacterium]
MTALSPATIHDIAKKAKVTSITVSRVFNHPELVKLETRVKILAIAKELNYLPNVFAQGLKKYHSNIIGIVTDSMFNPFYSASIQTISRIAKARGYQIMLFDTDGDEKAEQQAIETLLSYKANGILLSPIRDDREYHPDYIKILKYYKTPLILIDRDFYNASFPGIFLNDPQIGRVAGQFLAKQKSKKILIVGGPQNSQITQLRLNGMMESLKNTDKQIYTLFTNYAFTNIDPKLIFEQLAKIAHEPFWVIGLNGIITTGMIDFITRFESTSTKKIDVSYFSVDEAPYARQYGLKIPGVYHNTIYLGEQAAMLLFKLIENKNDLNKHKSSVNMNKIKPQSELEHNERIIIDGVLSAF